ncbi:MAG: DUF1553 domain-containing protein, partial [Planctomycetaceae bacterium]
MGFRVVPGSLSRRLAELVEEVMLRGLPYALLLFGPALWGSDETVDFGRDVRPILRERCSSCHGGVKQAGDLSFAYREHVLGPRPSGTLIVVPGEPEASELVRRITAADEAERMPPVDEHPEGLSASEIATLVAWVRQGAEWGEHWSFVRPRRQPLPSVQEASWCRQRIDQFILARLEREGFTPSPDAAADRWLRRVSLDLIGLPPTPADRERFLEAVGREGEAAYAAAVERLLDAPHFGERWASVWLDLVRYADSKGLGLDGRRSIWKYRDWVIDAFNRDLPYDEFTVQQLAGDLLPNATIDALMATACHRATQSNEEGGTDDEQFRVEAVVDRINTTWQVWQGLTFGCTQCHDHPYDPLRNSEYYRFMTFFNNTVDSDLDSDAPLLEAPLDPGDYERAHRLDRQIEAAERELWRTGRVLADEASQWAPLQELEVVANDDTAMAVERVADEAQYYTVDAVHTNTGFVISAPLPTALTQLTAVRFTGFPLNPQASLANPEWGFVLSHFKAELLPSGTDQPVELAFGEVVADEPHPLLDPALSLNAENPDGFAAFSRIHHPRTAVFVLKDPAPVPPGTRLRVTLAFKQLSGGSHPLVARRGSFAVSGDARWASRLNDPLLSVLRDSLARLREERKAIASVTLPVMADLPDWLARPTHVFERGNYLHKGEAVSPGTPAVLPPLASAGEPDRLDLARWFVADENPLTARVAVNRFWAQLFGTGLVETQEDFGISGDPPSHPELLDDLAVRFAADMSWSVKRLLKELTLSSTYRQSAVVRPEAAERDPQNRLLARGPRHRLPAESVRDQALAVAGILSSKLYGPPVFPPIPDGVWDPFQADDKWTTAERNDENRYRRSIYIYMKRTIPYPMFASFDTPSREFCSLRRETSNTPLQALMTLNDLSFDEAALALGRRMRGGHETLHDQMKFGLQLAT